MSKNSHEISKIRISKIIENNITKIKYDDVTKLKLKSLRLKSTL